MTITIFYVTFPNKQEAKSLAKTLLKEKLIVCANLMDSNSLYNFEGKINDEEEMIAIIKTFKANESAVHLRIKELHPYDVPCILSFPVDCNATYQEWVEKEVK